MTAVFEEDPPKDPNALAGAGAFDADSLLLNIDGFEGPIDVLLEMARNQKVDLREISILQLARQYLAFIERAQDLRLDLAAEYLVMAAWLAYLKSRLLLPKEKDESGEPSGEAMAEALSFQLRRLESMRKAATMLMARPQLGINVFARGEPEGLRVAYNATYKDTLYDLLKAYGDIRRRAEAHNYELPIFNVMTMEEAVERMTKMLGNLPRSGPHSVWTTLQSFMPERITDPLLLRSSLASTLTAGLELAKQGKVEIRQDGLFRPIYVRSANRPALMNDAPEVKEKNDVLRQVDLEKADLSSYKKLFADCIILTNDDRILMQSRPWDKTGKIAAFGGHVEEGETPLLGVIREIEEELGAKISVEELILLGAVTESFSEHQELVHVYFWHDKNGRISGCYEGEPRYFKNTEDAIADEDVMDYARWALKRVEEMNLTEGHEDDRNTVN